MARSFSSRSRVVRLLIARRRLFSSIVAGLILLALLPGSIWLTTRLLLAWDLMAAIYIVLAFWMFAGSTVDTCHRRARLYDEADWVILLLVIASAAASFVAIFAELAAVKSGHEPASIGLVITGATVALSWTFTHTIFTLHYANVYYRPDSLGTPGGLKFPGDRPPHYGDFLYYAFVIGCAAQTGDVATVSPAMRRLTLVHGVVAFAFNTAILALMINIGAGLLA